MANIYNPLYKTIGLYKQYIVGAGTDQSLLIFMTFVGIPKQLGSFFALYLAI